METVLGKEHPDTLTSVYCLAYLLHQKKWYKDAEGYQKGPTVREAANRGAEARQPATDGELLPPEIRARELREGAAAEQGELLEMEAATDRGGREDEVV